MPTQTPFRPVVQTIIEEFIPIIRRIAGDQRYAISVGGSLGKGTWDHQSDVDFRLFTDRPIEWVDKNPGAWEEAIAAMERWKAQGTNIDGVWCRTVGEIDAMLDGWCAGQLQPVELIWTIWGYHVLPDISNQYIIEDPFGIIAGWKQRLSHFPPALKAAIFEKYSASLRYWRGDYHYAHKVERGDPVFLAGMTAKLVHEILQLLFALNEVYYVGDGSNLAFAEKFKILPADFPARVQRILYPTAPSTGEAMQRQYAELCALIDEVLGMLPAQA